tara:strand:+ start:2753 stop:2935 length:183 start_codon:yes stop_codon:yes gene_type:complete
MRLWTRHYQAFGQGSQDRMVRRQFARLWIVFVATNVRLRIHDISPINVGKCDGDERLGES